MRLGAGTRALSAQTTTNHTKEDLQLMVIFQRSRHLQHGCLSVARPSRVKQSQGRPFPHEEKQRETEKEGDRRRLRDTRQMSKDTGETGGGQRDRGRDRHKCRVEDCRQNCAQRTQGKVTRECIFDSIRKRLRSLNMTYLNLSRVVPRKVKVLLPAGCVHHMLFQSRFQNHSR